MTPPRLPIYPYVLTLIGNVNISCLYNLSDANMIYNVNISCLYKLSDAPSFYVLLGHLCKYRPPIHIYVDSIYINTVMFW